MVITRKYLKELREKSGMTQLEVGKKLDVSESYYSLIEKGERQEDMSISMARKLADVFGVPIGKILEMEGGELDAKCISSRANM